MNPEERWQEPALGPYFWLALLTLWVALTLWVGWFVAEPATTPCGGTGTTPATGSHDRGRTI